MASVLILSILVISSMGLASSSPFTCSHQSMRFLKNLQSQCPISSCSTDLLFEVDYEFIDRRFGSKSEEAYTSILFYGSSCPFLHNVHLTFRVLSSMFPQIEHLAVEESSAMPSTFSQLGLHSLPAIIFVNKSSKLRYQGAKDLHSLVTFYTKITGEPVYCVATEQPISTNCCRNAIMQSLIGSSVDELLNKEPYLVFSLLFLCLSAFLHVFPMLESQVIYLWTSYQPLLKTNHTFERILQMINDVKRVWTVLKFHNTRYFHEGAKNARLWAASLTSVS